VTGEVAIPEQFTRLVRGRPAEGGPDGDTWLDALPGLVEELLARWELTTDGPIRYGRCALVVPVISAADPLGPAALKITWPHAEAAQEHLALRYWAGNGAVRLLNADPHRWAMLLERLHGDRDLIGEPIDDACTVIGGLLADLDRPARPQFDRLSDFAARVPGILTSAPGVLPRRFSEQAAALARDLAADPAVDARLVHTDLHYENVLAADRAPWLAIDPKPMAAEPAFAVAPALWNRWDEAVADFDVRWHLRRRVELICAAGSIDEDRARAWTIVREACNAAWEPTTARVGAAVTTIKAMQPGP